MLTEWRLPFGVSLGCELDADRIDLRMLTPPQRCMDGRGLPFAENVP